MWKWKLMETALFISTKIITNCDIRGTGVLDIRGGGGGYRLDTFLKGLKASKLPRIAGFSLPVWKNHFLDPLCPISPLETSTPSDTGIPFHPLSNSLFQNYVTGTISFHLLEMVMNYKIQKCRRRHRKKG